MKRSIQEHKWRYIGEVTSMYQIRKYNKIKKGAIRMDDGTSKFPHPYDVVLVNDKRSFKTVQYMFDERENVFKRLSSPPAVEVNLSTINKGN